MRNRRRWIFGVGLCCAALVMAGCGSSSETSEDDGGDSTTSTTAEGPLLDGTYVLTGTQSCKSATGGDPNTVPLFEDSTLVVSGDQATVTLRNEPLDASLTTDGESFHINQTFDLSGNPVDVSSGAAPGPNDLVLDLTGTSSDGGQSIEGTGSDMGVNCEYTFTGAWSDDPPDASEAGADPCAAMDPTGEIFDAWSHFDASLGEVRVVSACAEPWALVNFANADTTLVHLNGSIWEIADPADYCASTSTPVPSSPPGEDDPTGRILYSMCSPAAQPAPTTTTAPPGASAGPCTEAAIQAALPPEDLVAEPPRCEGEWAAAGVAFDVDAEALYLFHWDGTAWQHASQPDACAAGDLPPLMNDIICIHPSG